AVEMRARQVADGASRGRERAQRAALPLDRGGPGARLRALEAEPCRACVVSVAPAARTDTAAATEDIAGLHAPGGCDAGSQLAADLLVASAGSARVARRPALVPVRMDDGLDPGERESELARLAISPAVRERATTLAPVGALPL